MVIVIILSVSLYSQIKVVVHPIRYVSRGTVPEDQRLGDSFKVPHFQTHWTPYPVLKIQVTGNLKKSMRVTPLMGFQ